MCPWVCESKTHTQIHRLALFWSSFLCGYSIGVDINSLYLNVLIPIIHKFFMFCSIFLSSLFTFGKNFSFIFKTLTNCVIGLMLKLHTQFSCVWFRFSNLIFTSFLFFYISYIIKESDKFDDIVLWSLIH